MEEINKLVGSDSLGYLSIEHVQQLAIHSKCGFCTGCFTGEYPVNPPTETMDIVYDKPLSVSNPNKKAVKNFIPHKYERIRKGDSIMEKSYSASYAAAGVDITAGYRSVELMKQYVARTMTENCIGGLGGFGGLFELDCSGMEHPVLISGTDGVGTKLRIAMLLDKHDTIGIDCVAMCVNDVICAGAKPLVFLDYIACGKNIPEKIAEIVKGVAEGCVQAGCSLCGRRNRRASRYDARG